MVRQYIPIVEPHKSFQYVSLENARLGLDEQVVIHDPAQHFCTTQFRLMTIHEQLRLLADVVTHLGTSHRDEALPFQIMAIRDALDLEASHGEINHQTALRYYMHMSPRALERWLQEGFMHDSTRELIVERFLSDLALQLPAIACTLTHIYSGGYYGVLTARGDRDESHKEQLRYIGEMFGFGTPPELTYYVNDSELAKRLEGSTATRKATVLMNFATGFKQDESGNFVEMTVGKRFDEVGFIEDEAKNLKAVMHCLIRGVYTDVLYAVGWTHRTPYFEEQLNKRSLAVMESAYARVGAAATADMGFWLAVVDELLAAHTSSTGKFADRAALITELKGKKQWIPDIIKIYDANTLSVGPYIDTLREIFNRKEAIVMGTRPSMLFNDIDGTLLKVKAGFPILLKSDPHGEMLHWVSVEQFGLEPDANYWLQHVAKAHNLNPDELIFSWKHFRDPDVVRRDILAGCYRRHLNKKASIESASDTTQDGT
jgi:hypothetical protein